MTTPELQTPDAAGAKVAGGALLIDVRSAAGRASAGEIPGATLADRNDLDALFGPSDNPAITLDTPVVGRNPRGPNSKPDPEPILRYVGKVL